MVELAREQAMVIGASRDAQAKASSLTAAAVGASLGAGIVISCRNLKHLNLSGCKLITILPDLRTPNLEKLETFLIVKSSAVVMGAASALRKP